MELIDVLKQRLIEKSIPGFTKEQVKELKGKSFYGDLPVEGDKVTLILVYPTLEELKKSGMNCAVTVHLLYEKEFERFCTEYDLYSNAYQSTSTLEKELSESFIKVVKNKGETC